MWFSNFSEDSPLFFTISMTNNNNDADADSFSEISQEIYKVNIKNLGRKMIKKLCQIIAFVCIKIMLFLDEQLFIPTKNLFSNVINIMEGKIHLHHSHVTSKILGYAHSFGN